MEFDSRTRANILPYATCIEGVSKLIMKLWQRFYDCGDRILFVLYKVGIVACAFPRLGNDPSSILGLCIGFAGTPACSKTSVYGSVAYMVMR